MAHIPIDASVEKDIYETPIIPSGTNVTLLIADEPELAESKSTPPVEIQGKKYKAMVLNFMLKVVEAKSGKHIGVTIFHTQCVPGPAYKEKCTEEGYRFMCDTSARLFRVCGMPAGRRDTQRFVGKKIKVTLKVDVYEGVQRNKISAILDKG